MGRGGGGGKTPNFVPIENKALLLYIYKNTKRSIVGGGAAIMVFGVLSVQLEICWHMYMYAVNDVICTDKVSEVSTKYW